MFVYAIKRKSKLSRVWTCLEGPKLSYNKFADLLLKRKMYIDLIDKVKSRWLNLSKAKYDKRTVMNQMIPKGIIRIPIEKTENRELRQTRS